MKTHVFALVYTVLLGSSMGCSPQSEPPVVQQSEKPPEHQAAVETWTPTLLAQEQLSCQEAYKKTVGAAFQQAGKELPAEISPAFCKCMFSHVENRWSPDELKASAAEINKTLTQEGVAKSCEDQAWTNWQPNPKPRQLNENDQIAWMTPRLTDKCLEILRDPSLTDANKSEICACSGKLVAEAIASNSGEAPSLPGAIKVCSADVLKQ